MEKHKIQNIKRAIYYEYIELINFEIKYHLINVDSEKYSFIIPNTYKMNYSQSNNNYNSSGHIYFYNDKYSYTLDFTKRDYNLFLERMDNKKGNIVKVFKNYRGQEFYEVQKNNIDYIYMYYNGYYFKLYSDHKMSINEYFDMYLILISVNMNKINNNIELLKELYYFNMNSIKCLYNNIDLLYSNLGEYTNDILINDCDVIISNDNLYLEYKYKQNKIDLIAKDILFNLIDIKNEYVVDIIFKFADIGNYHVNVRDYNEIIDSEELSDKDKYELLYKMVEQKQNETYSNKDKINEEFNRYILDYLNKNLTYELWDNYHIREFINIDKFDDNLSDEEIYVMFKDNIYSDSILNLKLLRDSIVGDELNIYPNKYTIRLSVLNGLLNSLKIIFDEEYNLVDINK